MDEIRFDDIESLNKHVSDEFGPFGAPLEVDQALIDQFAEVTGDHQWIHVDVERAEKESPFGTTIAHGFLTLSLLPRLVDRKRGSFAVVGHSNAVNYGSDKLRFMSPVPAGAELHCRGRLVAVEAGAKGTRVEMQYAIHVVGSDRPAVVYNMITLYQGKAA